MTHITNYIEHKILFFRLHQHTGDPTAKSICATVATRNFKARPRSIIAEVAAKVFAIRAQIFESPCRNVDGAQIRSEFVTIVFLLGPRPIKKHRKRCKSESKYSYFVKYETFRIFIHLKRESETRLVWYSICMELPS